MSDFDNFDDDNDPDTSSGFVETTYSDTTGDGWTDTATMWGDTTGDGQVDTVAEFDLASGASTIASDTTGDGLVDTVAHDYDGDGIIDEAHTSTAPPVAATPEEPNEVAVTPDGPFDPEPTESVTGDPEVAEPTVYEDVRDDGVHGDPREDIVYHQVQPGPVDCLPTSVAMALTQISGDLVPAEDLVAMANQHGFMWSDGMAMEDAVTLFANYGVEAELTNGTADDLRDALQSGDPIIVGLDAADLYYGGGGPFDPGMEMGHAVAVTGIEDGPPEMVYINDPGFPDGAGVEIPMSLFIDAWEDSDHLMLVAEAPAGSDVAMGSTSKSDGAESAVHRILLLPFTFVVQAAAAA